MAIVHWHPWSGLDDLRDKLDRILAGEAARPGRGDCGCVWQPACRCVRSIRGWASS